MPMINIDVQIIEALQNGYMVDVYGDMENLVTAETWARMTGLSNETIEAIKSQCQ